MNIGLMGGTFNPIHFAHLRIAEEARFQCALERVLFIPAADPPHKPLAGDISFEERCTMVRHAIADNPAFELSAVEGERQGKSYSVDTLIHLQQIFPHDSLYFIIGSDSFREIGLWHRYQEIFRLCNLIVVERPGYRIEEPLQVLPEQMRFEFSVVNGSMTLQHAAGMQVVFLEGCPLQISSSKIRRHVAAGQSITYLVPPGVEAYIKNQRMYTE